MNDLTTNKSFYIDELSHYLGNVKELCGDRCNDKLVGSTSSVDIVWLKRYYSRLISSSERWMCYDDLGMPFVSCFHRIRWKIIIKVLEEAHTCFIEFALCSLPFLLWVTSLKSAFALYKQRKLSFSGHYFNDSHKVEIFVQLILICVSSNFSW